MVMSASQFMAAFKQIKAYIKQNPDASDELKEAAEDVSSAFTKAYTPEAFKAALKENAELGSDVEDRLSSAMVIFNRDRTKRGAG